MSEPKPRAWAAIDLLRCVCALLVVLYHYGTVFGAGASPHTRGMAEMATLPVGWRHVSWFGWVGVELFFVISGCVIAGSARGARPGQFLTRRLRRLAPAAWVCAWVSALLLATIGVPLAQLGREYWASATFWPVAPWIDQSFWTLGIEWVFYLLVAGVLGLPGGARLLERVAWVLAGASLLFWIALLAGLAPPDLARVRAAQLLLLPHGCCFAIGVFLRAALDEGWRRERVAGVLVGSLGAMLDIAAKAMGEAHALGVQGSEWAPLAIFAGGVALVAGASRAQPWFARLPRGWLTAAAAATYPLYLLHQEAGSVVFIQLQCAGVAPTAAIALAFVAMLAAAFAIGSFVEPWLRDRLVSARHVLRRDRRPSAFPSAG